MSEKELPKRICSCGAEMRVQENVEDEKVASVAPWTAFCTKCKSWFDVYVFEQPPIPKR